MVRSQGLHQLDFARRKAVGQVEDDQSQVVQSGGGAGGHRCRCRLSQVLRVVPFAGGELAKIAVQAGHLAGDATTGDQGGSQGLVRVAELAERGADAGLRAGMLGYVAQRAVGLRQRLPHRQVLQHAGERLASLLLQGGRAQQLGQHGHRHEPDIGEPDASQFLAQGQAGVPRRGDHGYRSKNVVTLLFFDEPPEFPGQLRRQAVHDETGLAGISSLVHRIVRRHCQNQDLPDFGIFRMFINPGNPLILVILILTFPRGKLGMREAQLRLKRAAGTGSSTPWSGNGQAGWVEPRLVS